MSVVYVVYVVYFIQCSHYHMTHSELYGIVCIHYLVESHPISDPTCNMQHATCTA
jgi:hypothetical protein